VNPLQRFYLNKRNFDFYVPLILNKKINKIVKYKYIACQFPSYKVIIVPVTGLGILVCVRAVLLDMSRLLTDVADAS